MTDTAVTPEQARRQLYEILDGDGPFERKAERALEVGVEYLGVENGYIARINERSDYWEAVVSTDTEDGWIPAGRVTDLGSMCCRRAIERETSLAVHDAVDQDRGDDPAFERYDHRCYHGTSLTVDGDVYGTVCFVSESPREPFTEAETTFAELLAVLLERELESRRHETELTRISNLNTVLNRVLRHNLRNSMTVIRAEVQMLAADDDHSQTIIERAEHLMDLSDKARKLESILVEDFAYRETDISRLVERVADEVAADYPAASVTVERSDAVTIAVQPTLETVLRELVENAAEHGGEAPQVTVSVEAVRNAVQVTVRDDGPGLGENERKVLTDGRETPLVHGSGLGLWMAYWVVADHDGTIEAAVSEEGTRMTIELPREVHGTAPGDGGTDRSFQRVQDRFRAVFDGASDAIVVVDDDGKFADLNDSATDLFDIPKQDLLGRSIAEFAPGALGFDEAWGQFRAAGRQRGTFELVRPDGTERIVEYTGVADIVAGQDLAIMRDVTERKRREQELAQLEAILETAFENVLVVF